MSKLADCGRPGCQYCRVAREMHEVYGDTCSPCPVVKGGQGRTTRSVKEDAGFYTYLVMLIGFGVIASVLWRCA